MPLWYFAYGSNLDQEGMRRRVGGWLDVKPAKLKGYEITFNVFSSSWRGGIANIVEKQGGVVYGAAYLLEESQLERLDRYEGVPHLYHRRKVTVVIDTGSVDAYVYVGSNPRQKIAASHEYLALVLKGLKRLGYGEEIINAVKHAAETVR